MSQVGIIVAREFNERVRKKSFIITTLLVPLFMLSCMVIPALIMAYGGGSTKHIAVIDPSGVVAPALESNDDVVYIPTGRSFEEVVADETLFGVLLIGDDVVDNPSNVKLYTSSSSSMMLESLLIRQIEDAIRQERIRREEIDNLAEVMERIQTSVTLQTFRTDRQEQMQSAGVAYALGYILAFVLYMFLLLYGQMVMTGVIEEKGSRVLDVMITSVPPFRLMLGKILGIATVAVTQIVIWCALLVVIFTTVLPAIIPADTMAQAQALQAGRIDPATLGDNTEMLQALAAATDLGYLGTIMIYLVLFLVGGYLLYSALFAAVGASVDNVQDAAQLSTVVTMPIIVGIFAMIAVMADPNSGAAFWFSMIPFTSPMVMMARIPAGIPAWQPVLSLAILLLTTLLMIWIAAKIYRVGIFLHGKKPKIKDLARWVTYKG